MSGMMSLCIMICWKNNPDKVSCYISRSDIKMAVCKTGESPYHFDRFYQKWKIGQSDRTLWNFSGPYILRKTHRFHSELQKKGRYFCRPSQHQAGVAAPASLLARWARGCNEIYHLWCLWLCTDILRTFFFSVKDLLVPDIVLKAVVTDLPTGDYRAGKSAVFWISAYS